MGLQDAVTAKYVGRNDIFADVFNYYIYGGEQVITPDSLEELDTREVDVPYGGVSGAGQPVQRTRDVIRSVIAKTDKNTAYLLLAIENQTRVHYAMPVRNMVYDALQYAKQVTKAALSHRLSGDYKEAGGDEYLSGFMKSDRLLPVVTLVIYFGCGEWDGPLSIHEMFAKQDKRVLALVPDYKINLLAPISMTDEELGKYRTTFKEVFSFIKYSKEKDKLKRLLSEDKGFCRLGRDEVDVLNACTGAKLTLAENGKGVIDVCTAIQEMVEEGRVEGRVEGRIEALVGAVKNLMDKTGWTQEQSMDALGIQEEDKEKISAVLKKKEIVQP